MNELGFKKSLLGSALVLATVFQSQASFAQATFSDVQPDEVMSSVPGEMDAIEQLYAEDPGKRTTEIIEDGKQKPITAPKSDTDIKGVSDLSSLSEFKDIAVIQKRFLPKTQRFEGFGGLNGILNDKFFSSIGFNGRLGYHFTERLGIELLVMLLATGERDVTKNLRERRGVVTTNFVSPQNYYGADIRWTPVYGKMSFLNNKITTFDLYFSAGAGITNTNQGGSEPTIHLGTGQVFAITKSAAFRWDFSWNFYNAKSGVAGAQQNSLYNNLFLTLGASFFFPEATYR
ncbi:MAG: outer membrane beta-barrel domain-containing protein [Bdellovibrionales bacterium]|nr:outer membrane beta-barrel domain-containing protein [Bdellovibrionales bacterium]